MVGDSGGAVSGLVTQGDGLSRHERARQRPRTLGRKVVLGYIPSLDGVRALALAAVLLYHGAAPLSSGGFLGVDVFFVLSGFLITSLLLEEWAETLTIRLGRFWAGRARRLLPALVVMVAVVVLCAHVVDPSLGGSALRFDGLAALFYVANWHAIFGASNYFGQSAPGSPLVHLWTLAVEEQFYLVWPPVVLVLLHLGRRFTPARRLLPVMAVASFGVIASVVEMQWGYARGWSVTRLYEGTDTRAQDVLMGAVLACGLAWWAERRRSLEAPLYVARTSRGTPASTWQLETWQPLAGSPVFRSIRRQLPQRVAAWEVESTGIRRCLQVTGILALATLVVAVVTCRGLGPWFFRGGGLLVAAASALLLLVLVTTQDGVVARTLALAPLRFLGRISYGAYLWHLPVYVALSPSRVPASPTALLVLRLVVTLAIATASYFVVELPIRQRRFALWRHAGGMVATGAAVVAAAALVLVATGPIEASATPVAVHPATKTLADTRPPIRVMVVGDSVAYRLAQALQAAEKVHPTDIVVDNAAIVGCGVIRSEAVEQAGFVGHPTAACSAGTPHPKQWPALWRHDLAGFHPDLVVLLAGRWEVSNLLIGGTWQHIGQPGFDALLKASLEQAVLTASSGGATVALMTAACYHPAADLGGASWPEDSASRISQYDAMLRTVATEYPARTIVDDFGGLVCPGGHYAASVDGVALRSADGIHLNPTAAVGQWFFADLWPPLASRVRPADPAW